MIPLPLAGVVAAALIAASCGAPLMKLPAGPGAPASDARAALAEATRTCGAVSSITAAVGVSGSVGGRRLRGRLDLGLAPPASARIEAVAPFGQPVFIFVARGGEATLLLTRENRVLERGRPEAVLEAITGVPLGPADLRTALIGCTSGADMSQGRLLGDDWRVLPEGPDLIYLRRETRTAPWRLVAAVHRQPGRPEWRAEYLDFKDGLPQTIRFASSERDWFNLRLELSQIELNTTLPAQAFDVNIPANADPITLDELRRAGPLGGEP
jgi:hypothetical protein